MGVAVPTIMQQKFLKINKTCNFRCGSRTTTQTHGIPSPTHTHSHSPPPNGPSVTTKKHRVPSPPHGRALSFSTRHQQPKTELCLCVSGDQMDRPPSHARMMTTEWSFPRLNLPPTPTAKSRPWTKWALIALAVLTIVSLPHLLWWC